MRSFVDEVARLMNRKAKAALALTAACTVAPALFPARAHAQQPHVEQVQNVHGVHPLPFYAGGRVLLRPVDASSPFGPEIYVYQWPGIYFRAAFTGPELFFEVLPGYREILHLTVDDQPSVAITTTGKEAEYRVSGLTDAPHTVRLQVVTELQAGAAEFGGFAVPTGESAGIAPVARRQIEFIGDSHTVGYGNTSSTRTCTPDEVWARTDDADAFGPMLADQFHAEYQVNAISGHGIVRNYNGSPGDPVPVAYPYMLLDHSQAYTPGDAWQPQMVVIALGTNDFSTPLNPGEPWKTRDELHADYEATYVRFVQSLRARYPKAYFILWATDASNGEIASEEQRVVAKLQASGEARIHFMEVSGLSFSACDWHPSLADDRAIYDRLKAFIDQNPQLWRSK